MRRLQRRLEIWLVLVDELPPDEHEPEFSFETALQATHSMRPPPEEE